MKKIFVTGGCGFIGSNFIINQITKYQNKIFNYDKLTYAGNQDNLKTIQSNPLYTFKQGDILQNETLLKCIFDFKPDYIINFAAESHVDRSIDNPKEFINTNVLGTYELLQASLKYYDTILKEKQIDFKLLHISTDEVYGSLGEKGNFTEDSPYNPSSPYSASKASSDHLVLSWHITYGLPIVITNCTNNYGPFQFPEKLIPRMIINCLNKQELPIYGDGSNIRDWLYVEDHCEALYMILKKGEIGNRYNIASNEELTNIQIIDTICEILDRNQSLESDNSYKSLKKFIKDRPGHDYRYALDASKTINKIGWEPSYTFKDGLSYTIDWYVKNKMWWKNLINNKYSLSEIRDK